MAVFVTVCELLKWMLKLFENFFGGMNLFGVHLYPVQNEGRLFFEEQGK